jgi:hypothetical protein
MDDFHERASNAVMIGDLEAGAVVERVAAALRAGEDTALERAAKLAFDWVDDDELADGIRALKHDCNVSR